MEVESKVVKINEQKIKAVASIIIDKCFLIRNIKIMEGKTGIFLAMPTERYKNTYKDICFPITEEARQKIYNEIIKEYKKL